MVDNDKQMYETGEMHLSSGEFLAAVDAFNSILEKDPHDFFALRGLLLASAHLTDMDELASENKRKGFAYNADLISETIESASEEDRKYFKEFGRIFSDKKRLYDLNLEINSAREEERKLLTAVNLDNEERTYYYVMDRHGQMKDPRITFFPLLICGVIMLISGLPFFVMQADLGSDGVAQAVGWFSVIIGTVITGSDLIFVYPKVREIKDIDQHCQKIQAEALLVEEKIKGLEAEADKLEGNIRTSVLDFVKKDKLKTGNKN